MVPEGTPGTDSRHLYAGQRNPLRVRVPERLPPDPERASGGAQGWTDLAEVAEVPAGQVSPDAEGLHDPGRAERPLDARCSNVGEGEQGDLGPLGDECLVDEPGGVPRGTPS